MLNFNFPVIKPFHLSLYYFQYFAGLLWKLIFQKLWSIPLFKARCLKAGKNLSLPNGIPYIDGHLSFVVGDNVTIYRTTFGSTRVYDNPVLEVGNNVIIGYGTVISVGKKVTIGDYTMIAPNCFIADNNGHPINPDKRLQRLPVDKKEIEEIVIGENVWIATNVIIKKGVNIGKNSIIGANSVVSRDIPDNCIAMGIPARPVIMNIDKKG